MVTVMKKIISLCFLVLLLAGCKPAAKPQVKPENLRILSLVTCADHIITELGAKDKIAAIDRHGRVLDSMQDVPVTVAGGMVSREMLRKYKINHAVIWYYQQNLIPVFEQEGVGVTVIPAVNSKSYIKVVQKLGLLCNKNEEAEKLAAKFRQTIPEISPVKHKPVIVYMELYTPWKAPAEAGYMGEMLSYAGGQLAAAGKINGTVSPEAVALAKPEVIFFVEGFGSVDELAGRPALRNTPAVKNRKIYAIPRKLVCEGVAPEELLNFFTDKMKDR